MLLKDQVAVVTGSSRGIGAATAIKLAEEGADVVVNYNNDKESAEETAQKIRDLGRQALVIQGNVAEMDDAKNLIKATVKEFDKIDILVNNAGITKDGLLLRMKEKDFNDVINVNLQGTFNCTKQAIRYMMKQHHGKIVNLSSVVGLMGNAGQANYSASKAGIVGFTKSVAREVSKRGINVNAVAPGYINTDMTEELPAKVKEDMLKNIPLDRFGEVEDVANVIMFLVSPLANYVNGQTINIDGGMLM
ncbi:MAG TPA: 3-oxoacyl-[acyl-carrier-protein] reductase [Halanaerobiales bacterium]|nr:3-oxoacyl-[acyl-carrier-protein] reductase [Halanaerobiales bacterium]